MHHVAGTARWGLVCFLTTVSAGNPGALAAPGDPGGPVDPVGAVADPAGTDRPPHVPRDTLGWDAGRPDDVKVEIGAVLHFRYTASLAPSAPDPIDDPSVGFSFRRLRPTFDLEAFDGKLGVSVQTEGREESVELVDLYAYHAPTENWRLRIGQFRLNFHREMSVSATRQLAVDRGSLANTVNPGAAARVMGFEARYTEGTDRVYLTLSEGVGAELSNYNRRRPQWGVTLRGERLLIGDSFGQFRQFTAPRETPRGLMLGAAGHVQHLGDDGTGAGQGSRWAATADLNYQHDGFNAAIIGAMHSAEDRNERASTEPEHLFGLTALGAYYITETVEPFVRYEWGTSSDQTHPDLHTVTAGVNWYILGQILKLSTDVTVGFDGVGPAFDRSSDGLLRTPDGDERVVFRTQLQMLF